MFSKRKKLKKTVKLFLLSVFVLCACFIGIVTFKTYDDVKIKLVLATKNYSYLPVEAKDYIKDIYEETGNIILTEKNKKVNMPYLNSQFVEYLALSDEEKKNVSYIPEVYVIDYVENEVYEASLPSKFDLTNYNGSSYVSNTRNQGKLGVCWAIAACENVETYLMWKDKKAFDSNSAVFSSRQFDYATSTNGMYFTISGDSNKYYWNNPNNGYRELGQGGNFYFASVAMSNGITLTDSSVIPWNESLTVKKPEEVLNLSNSEYEALTTVQLPVIDSDTASSSDITSFTNMVKNYIYQYGGLFVGTLSPQSTCGFKNTDGTNAIKTDDCYESNIAYGHAMQIVGWDDNYSYTYCDKGTSHSAYDSSCSSSYKKEGKGAWILRNSWGDNNEYKYVYLTYDSTRVSIGFVKEVSKMSDRLWDTSYYLNPFTDNKIGLTVQQSNTLNTGMDEEEKVELVKFHTYTRNGSYRVTLSAGENTISKTITTEEFGMQTVNFTDSNFFTSDSQLVVTVEGINGSYLVKNTLALFTSAVSNEPIIQTVYSDKAKDVNEVVSDDNPLYVVDDDAFISFVHYTRNIPSGAKIDYKLYKDGEDYTNYFFGSKNLSYKPTIDSVPLDGVIESTITAGTTYWSDKNLCGETFRFQVIYNGKVLEEFPLKRHCQSKVSTSPVYLHSNDDRGIIASSEFTDLTNVKFMNVDGSGDADLSSDAGKRLFRPDKHIVSWNTKADGSGTTYTTNNLYLYKRENLYAMWASGHDYYVSYNCSSSDCNGSYSSKVLKSYGKEFVVLDNTFTNENGEEFLYWLAGDKLYYPEEIVKDIGEENTPYNKDEVVDAEAVWSGNYKTISFDANGGTGSMSSIKMDSTVYTRLKYNLFSNGEFEFKNWNTEADGTGTNYSDGYAIKPSENMTLYAQWGYTQYSVRFDANGGTGSMDIQNFEHTVSSKLNSNLYVRDGYTFVGWNTKADGTGDSYSNQANVLNLTDKEETITLYAQWDANEYVVKFDANGGSGTMSNQTFIYDTEQILSENKFTHSELDFKEWNTKSDGSGTGYKNKASVKNLIIGGSITLYAQWREPVEYVINEYVVDDDNKSIDSITINTTVDDFKKNIDLGNDYTVEVDSKVVEGKNLLYTGGKTKIYKNSVLVDEYVNIVRGEVNGDGKIGYADYVQVYNHIFKTKNPTSTKKLLVNEFAIAGDISGNNRIGYEDYVKIYNKIQELKGGTN